ncbi:MAG: ROK family protein, partial [Patescibacteria group bacterium]
MLKNNKKHTIGVDIGGTNMKAVLFDGQKVIADYSLATPKENLNQLLTMLKALIDPLLEKAKKEKIKIEGLGLSIAGTVDFNKQIITKSPNIPILNEVNLGKELEDKIGLPAIMDNDGNCFVWAEAKLGAGKKYSNFYGLTI